MFKCPNVMGDVFGVLMCRIVKLGVSFNLILFFIVTITTLTLFALYRFSDSCKLHNIVKAINKKIT